MVKRYELVEEHGCRYMDEDEHGEYVRYEDYECLLRKKNDLEREYSYALGLLGPGFNPEIETRNGQ